MAKILGVKVKRYDPLYYYSSEDYRVSVDYNVIVETPLGMEFAKTVVVYKEGEKEIDDVKEIVRVASHSDLEKHKENGKKEEDAKAVFIEKAKQYGLEMKLVDIRCLFDASKIIFYFTAEGRIDFRELVKDLASKYKVRIELRQIGVRDETKMLGGMGICGRKLCCASVLDNFRSVSINMAKEQNISLNPSKISGTCGRLMCCLEYENEGYICENRKLPGIGDYVKTAEGKGVVIGLNTLKKLVRVSIKKTEDEEHSGVNILEFPGTEVEILEKRSVPHDEGELEELKNLEDKNE